MDMDMIWIGGIDIDI